MGVIFLENLGGTRSFFCKNCGTYLTNRDQILSTRFTSGSGPAVLFKKVVNVVHGEAESRTLVTGPHVVRDVYCKKCTAKLGWFYEFAKRSNQMYKEGNTILEEARIYDEDDFE